MATCDHQSMLEIDYKWTASEAWFSWETVEMKERSKPLSFPFLPEVEFYILNKYHKLSNEIECLISCTGKSAGDDVECYLWENDNDVTSGLKKHKVVVNTPCVFSYNSYFTLMHCKIVYKKPCPICADQKAAADEIQQLRSELAKQAANVANLIVERDNFAAECKKIAAILTRTEGERDEWKAIARERKVKLVDMTEKSQLTTKQLNSTVEQLKLELNNRTLVDNSELLWKLQKENKLTDFSLMVDGKSIQVHKNVLAVKSKFFVQQFEEHPEKLEYSIEGTTYEAVEQMVEFVYLGDAENFGEHLNELYKLSVRFQIDDLKEKCVKSLESKRTIGKSPEMFILAIKYKDEKLSQLVIKYVQEKGGKESLLLSDEFLNLLKTDVELYTEVLKALRRSTNQN
ncbi:BTB domain-containing protein [Aphelenchoides besseyi]|nr:BTB domain-containing protein [Aphelenchoides besseyi]